MIDIFKYLLLNEPNYWLTLSTCFKAAPGTPYRIWRWNCRLFSGNLLYPLGTPGTPPSVQLPENKVLGLNLTRTIIFLKELINLFYKKLFTCEDVSSSRTRIRFRSSKYIPALSSASFAILNYADLCFKLRIR